MSSSKKFKLRVWEGERGELSIILNFRRCFWVYGAERKSDKNNNKSTKKSQFHCHKQVKYVFHFFMFDGADSYIISHPD